ncbi:MAG: DUF1611 domain-containing protein [Flavobacteriaceae bacterium]|nr:DUF1611 domain-containing protein [Flavobacteriaceae bacterium]
MHSILEQINAIQTISGKPVIAITLNHEQMKKNQIQAACEELTQITGLPCYDVLEFGPDALIGLLKNKA